MLHILLIIVVGLLVYSNTASVPFHLDDIRAIVENPVIKNLQYFVDPSLAKGLELYDSRFIGYLSFALNYKVHGLDVTGYHITNIAVHIINALFVYSLVLLTFRTPFLKASISQDKTFIALLASMLFISHPLQTQAVTYIVQRFASLATLFYLAAITLYVKWRLMSPRVDDRSQKTDRKGMPHPKYMFWYVASLVSAIFAMTTKEIAFTLPVMIAVYEFMFFEGKIKKRILSLIPFLLTMLIIPFALIQTGKPISDIIGDASDVARLQTDISRGEYLVTQFRVIVTYIRLLFFPINQNLDYDYPLYHSLFESEVFLSFLFLLSIFGLAIYLLYRSRFTSQVYRLSAFGIFWFFIALSVESSLIPIADLIFEHRVYLPSVGVCIAVAASAVFVADKLNSKHPNMGKVFASAFLLIIVLLSGVTYARNTVWQDKMRLWEDVVRKSSRKARPHYHLASAYKDNRLLDKAIEHYQVALRLEPIRAQSYHAQGYNNLGVAYYEKGLVDDAIDQYQQALNLDPECAKAYANLGVAYFNKGRVDMAIEQYQKSLRLKPEDADALYNLGNAYYSKGWVDMAVEQYYSALRVKPTYVEAHFNLGIVYFEKGLRDMACKEFETVLRLNPGVDQARRMLLSCR